jgi:hypothetical protein
MKISVSGEEQTNVKRRDAEFLLLTTQDFSFSSYSALLGFNTSSGISTPHQKPTDT